MSTFAEAFVADFRGSILTVLTAAGCECSLAMLRSSLDVATPHDPSMDQLRMEITWLSERGLVTQRRIDGVIEGVIVSERGQDVARGRARVPGVDVPDAP